MEYYTVYKTTNIINEKIYIGKHKTKDLNDGYLGSGKYIQRAIEKYGIKNFNKEILFVYDNEQEMNEKESELVTEEFIKEKTNYNLCPGGKGGFGYINNNSDFDNQKKIGRKTADKILEKKYGENWRGELAKLATAASKNISVKNRKIRAQKALQTKLEKYGCFPGTPHSDKTKKKMSKVKKGKYIGEKNSQFGTCWITNGTENKKIKKNVDLSDGWCYGRKMK